LLERCRASGLNVRYAHAGNSATGIDTPELAFNMVRLGISLYGLYPSDEVDRSRVALEPLLKFVSRVVMVKDVPPGTPIGYGGTYTAAGTRRIATVPVGYADGYSRLLTGKAMVLIRGERRPVVGRICMDQCMVDATGLDVRIGDEVVLIGSQGTARITADEVAAWLGTIHYEVTSKIANRVPRVYIRNGERIETVNPLLH
jgi:alanine racemase